MSVYPIAVECAENSSWFIFNFSATNNVTDSVPYPLSFLPTIPSTCDVVDSDSDNRGIAFSPNGNSIPTYYAYGFDSSYNKCKRSDAIQSGKEPSGEIKNQAIKLSNCLDFDGANSNYTVAVGFVGWPGMSYNALKIPLMFSLCDCAPYGEPHFCNGPHNYGSDITVSSNSYWRDIYYVSVSDIPIQLCGKDITSADYFYTFRFGTVVLYKGLRVSGSFVCRIPLPRSGIDVVPAIPNGLPCYSMDATAASTTGTNNWRAIDVSVIVHPALNSGSSIQSELRY